MKDEQEIIQAAKIAYIARLKYLGVSDSELNRFMWSENKQINLNIYKIFEDSNFEHYLIFATESDTDAIIFKDFVDQTHNYDFEQCVLSTDKIRYLQTNNFISSDLVSQINSSSLNTLSTIYTTNTTNNAKFFISSLQRWVVSFANNEYEESKKTLEDSNSIEPLPMLNKKLFIDKYHFNEMLETINNEQFSDEFNQCLFAYENGKWFLCAAGIGSVLEHLMLLILTNYGTHKALGRNPTAKDYLKAFTNKPISLESRQQTYIDTLFRLRNSVDHHNSGYTSKGICDMLLDGIRNVFNEYYTNSLAERMK